MPLIKEIKEITANLKINTEASAYRPPILLNRKEFVNMTKENNYKNNFKSDGIDEEFSMELADKDDLEAQARADAANQRAAKRKNK